MLLDNLRLRCCRFVLGLNLIVCDGLMEENNIEFRNRLIHIGPL